MTSENIVKNTAEQPFQHFCLSIYSKSDVEDTCLKLQDEYGADVLLLLYCCWLGRHGIRILPETVRRADTSISPFRETAIQPLRTLRKRLKMDVGGIGPTQSDALRQTVKSAELAAELLLIDHLYALTEHLPGKNAQDADRNGVIRANLLTYMEYLKGKKSDSPRDLLETLVTASTG